MFQSAYWNYQITVIRLEAGQTRAMTVARAAVSESPNTARINHRRTEVLIQWLDVVEYTKLAVSELNPVRVAMAQKQK